MNPKIYLLELWNNIFPLLFLFQSRQQSLITHELNIKNQLKINHIVQELLDNHENGLQED